MKSFTLLQTGEVVEQQAAATQETTAPVTFKEHTADEPNAEQGAAKSAQQGGGMQMFIMLGLIFVVMYFFMIRPQKKQQKELDNFRNSLKKGDKVVTIGGIYGTVCEIKDTSVLIEVDNSVKIRVSKQALVKDFTDPSQQ